MRLNNLGETSASSRVWWRVLLTTAAGLALPGALAQTTPPVVQSPDTVTVVDVVCVEVIAQKKLMTAGGARTACKVELGGFSEGTCPRGGVRGKRNLNCCEYALDSMISAEWEDSLKTAGHACRKTIMSAAAERAAFDEVLDKVAKACKATATDGSKCPSPKTSP